MTSRRLLIALTGALLAVAVGAQTLRDRPGQAEAPVASQPAHAPATLPAAQPATSATGHTLALPAILIADETVDLYAKASGYVSSIVVDIGSRVRKGDVLVSLSIPELEADLKHAEAELAARKARVEALKAKAAQAELLVESARAEAKRYAAEHDLSQITFKRKEELFRGKAIPAQEFDVARSQMAVTDAQLAMAQARVAAAEGEARAARADVQAAEAEIGVAEADVARTRTLLAYTSIAAPFDGIITRRNVDHGAFVRSAAQGPTNWLLTIVKVNRIRVVVDVPEADSAYVRPGMPVLIQIRALSDEAIKASITRIAGAVRYDTRSMRAEIDVENRDGRLDPGMYAKVSIDLNETR